MPILDFTTLTTQELQAYFHEGSLGHDAGYSDYELEFLFQQSNHYKQRITEFFANENINGAVDVLELGGARGHRAVYALDNFGLKSWEIIEVYDSPNKQTHNKLSYTFGDANTLLSDSKLYKNNKIDVLVSFRFMDCIPEANLPDIISNMNRITKQKQYHAIDIGANPLYYSERDLVWWSTQPFNSGTVLIPYRDFQHGNFANIIRVP